jgi:hypothetical protein
MSGLSTVFPDSIDEVLTAVQETPRGRWFLEAYSNRIKGDSTANILQAIGKLEQNLKTMTTGGAEAGLLQHARSAIAAAKREISLLEPQTVELSAEGQLFAKLAELSRASFAANAPGQVSVASGVDRVLKLVADLDRDLGVSKNDNAVAASAPASTKPAIQYFKPDEEIFEPAPAPVIAAVAKPAPITEVTTRGAKLVIQRISSPKPETIAEPIVTEEPRVEPPAIISSTQPEAKPQDKSRIVIIRRKAEDMVDVPLMDELALESMTAA